MTWLPAGFESVTSEQRKTLIAAALGWALDAFDVMLYSMVIAHIMRDLGMTKGMAGLLNTLTLLASGLGGLLFGFIADRAGRKRALMLSVLTYSVFSFASGLATSVKMLAAFRFVLGLGMGGEWNTGATLVAETWPIELRAKALAIVQSSWALGFAAAALVAGIMLRHFDWRTVFFVGLLPAAVTLWIRRSVPESPLWREHRARKAGGVSFGEMFTSRYLRSTLVLLLVNFFGMFGWWGLFTWIPPYLSLPVDQGGRGFSVMNATGLLVFLNLAGMFPGYASFGWVAERFGRKRSFLIYLLLASVLVPAYAMARGQITLLLLGPLVAFFSTGFFSGSSLVASEIFHTGLRARALGFTYNGARMMSAVSPYIIGRVGQQRGLSGAFFLCATAFFVSAVLTTMLPETKGKSLD